MYTHTDASATCAFAYLSMKEISEVQDNGVGTKFLITEFLITKFLTHKVPNHKIPT